MLDWIQKQIEKWAGGLVDDALSQGMAEQMALLDKIEAGLGPDVLAYLRTGEGEDVLARVQAAMGQVLRLSWEFRSLLPEQRGFARPLLEALDQPDPELLYRIAELCRVRFRNFQAPSSNPDAPHWLLVLLLGTGDSSFRNRGVEEPPLLTVSCLEALLARSGLGPEVLVRTPLFAWSDDENPFWCWMFGLVKGYADRVAAHPEPVREALRARGAYQRVHALEYLSRSGVAWEPFVAELVDLATSSSKAVRQAAEPILLATGEAADRLRDQATSGKAGERLESLRMLARLGPGWLGDFLRERRESEKAARVKAQIEEQLAGLEAREENDAAEIAPAPELGEIPSYELHQPLGSGAREAFRVFLDFCQEKGRKDLAHWEKHYKDNPFNKGREHPGFHLDEALFESVVAQLEGGRLGVVGRHRIGYNIWNDGTLGSASPREARRFVLSGGLHLLHVLRFLELVEELWVERGTLGFWMRDALVLEWSRKQGEPLTSRHLARALEVLGVDPVHYGRSLLSRWGGIDTSLPLEDVWGLYVEYPLPLEEALGVRQRPDQRPPSSETLSGALRLLTHFPRIPERLEAVVWELALGTGKTHRKLAQACLEKIPGAARRVMASLRSSQKGARAVAAAYLGEHRVAEALPDLIEVARKEKVEEALDAQLTAIEQLGGDLGEFFDREKLLVQAEKTVPKTGKKLPDWVRRASWPALHWDEDGAEVPEVVVTHFLCQAIKLRKPEPGAMLRRWFELMRPEDTAAFAEAVLAAWLEADTHTISREEAERKAEQNWKAYRSYYPDSNETALRNRLVKDLQIQHMGSAMKEKGLLALAACGAGDACVPPVRRYLKEWYGQRAHQCKALLAMLAWSRSPLGVQLLLATSVRFRTAGVRKFADQCVRELAERRGWTRDELSDRAVPTAELDERGELVLDYGERQFVASLTPEATLLLRDPDGKTRKSLPAARKSEDAERVKAEKKRFTAAKKQLREVVALQRIRLYESMCTQRRWSVSDWRTYLQGHPVVGLLCQGLVWVLLREDAVVGSFRPLEDGTWTDVEDEAVAIPEGGGEGPGVEVALAHTSLLGPEAAAAWRQHLEDYEVEPLFEQLRSESFVLPEERGLEPSLEDFEGHVLESFALRGRASKLGYTRGPTEDGGWFFTYRKDFPSLGLRTVVEFTGNFLPEENRDVALRSLGFERLQENEEAEGGTVALGEVPRVLLSEAWNDLRQMAEDGKGFHPDWEKRTEY